MKHFYLLLTVIILSSCGNEKILLLPEVHGAPVTEVSDVSHAYLFYDETQTDSVELNRKNLIGTTNWLINVDKRLTLAQAIPKIKFLQDKKRNAKMHKNENAKNYYTCNDTSIQNLGFLEFTDVVYNSVETDDDILKIQIKKEPILLLKMNEDSKITASDIFGGQLTNRGDYSLDDLSNNRFKNLTSGYYSKIILMINTKLSFQDYIKFKCSVDTNKISSLVIDSNEFIY
ncbi:hypothetical protein [Psychroserpens algicola]|uniref:hypothetical protein n=1 Tax=Psychroserpens algicola TaxID=1719034 RepID=UPI0019549F13|nr:hypothetical protein [Psychroserpens algicola]